MQFKIKFLGDRTAAIRYLKQNSIEYKVVGGVNGTIFVKDTYIQISGYGGFHSRMSLDVKLAKSGKIPSGDNGYGDECLPVGTQRRHFRGIQSEIEEFRIKDMRGKEEEMREKERERNEAMREIRKVINFEKKIIREEHELEEQIGKTIRIIADLRRYFPDGQMVRGSGDLPDSRSLTNQIGVLNEVLDYVEEQEIEAIKIVEDTKNPIRFVKTGMELKRQKKHLNQIRIKLSKFTLMIERFLTGKHKHLKIQDLDLTPQMKLYFERVYRKIFVVFRYYQRLFEKEAKKA
mgnify:CR=1 FL=1|tara:strand:- start:1383 stop:2252 length:870 start_codon:yes stop_codon:yes gene_type:complete